MAGRLFSLRLLRFALRPSPLPLSLSPLDSPLISLLASRFFSSRRAAAVSKEKSLIDDEAELSDWISDLKTDTVRFRVSDSDDDDEPRRISRSSRGSMQKSDRFLSRGKGFTEERGFRGRGFRDNRSDSDEDEPRMRRNNASLRGSSQKRRSYSDSDDNDRFNSRDKGFNEERGFKTRGFRDNKGFGGRRDNNEERGFRGGGARSSETQRGGRRENRKESNLNFSVEEKGFRGGSRVPETQRGGRKENKKDSNFNFSNEGIRGFTKTGRIGRETDLLGLSEKEDESDNGFSDSEEFLREDNKSESSNKTKNNEESLDLENDDELVKIKSSNEGESSSYLSQKRFDECTSLSEITLKGVKSAGYEIMTIVQEATLPVILQGKDVLAKARTGTGKTVAFLLPAIEMISKLPPINRDDTKPAFNVLIICPTRELAAQAAQEAAKLLKCHASISVQLLIGGTVLAKEQRRMQTNPSQILVGTPGRLKDHIENTAGFANRLKGVKVLVLDEADRLLDMGFRPVIENIIGSVNKNRQTLLFSATVPDDVKQMCYIALKRDFEFINTVEEGSEETHAQVKQMHIVAPLEKQFAILHGLLNDHISENIDYKVIVFCTTAMMTRLVAEYLAEMKLNIREIHSRKPQNYRTRVSKEFKESKGLILVSSDVSARGVDYPDVTLVIQLGVPADREQYIHRLGRTGRKGKQGTGILLLAPWENYFLRTIQDLPITESPLPLIDSDTTKKVQRALAHVDNKDKEKAYQAWLGYYNSNKNIGKDKYNLVSLANEFSRSIGMDNPPALPKIILRKMGLNNIPGLRTK